MTTPEKPAPSTIRRDCILETPMPPKWKALLWIVHIYCNDRHRAWCSVRRLATASCYTRSSVQRTLEAMQEAGIIIREPRWKEGENWKGRQADLITIRLQTLRKFNFQRWYARQAKFAKPEKRQNASHGAGHPVSRHGTDVVKSQNVVHFPNPAKAGAER